DHPRPSDQADRPEQEPEPTRRNAALAENRWVGPDVGDEHERERQPDRDRGTGQVDGQRQAALVGAAQLVGEDRGRPGKPKPTDRRGEEEEGRRSQPSAHVRPPDSGGGGATRRARRGPRARRRSGSGCRSSSWTSSRRSTGGANPTEPPKATGTRRRS